MKHMDICYLFVRQYFVHGVIEIEFVRSKNNTSDVCTKNVSHDMLEHHMRHFLKEFPSKFLNGA